MWDSQVSHEMNQKAARLAVRLRITVADFFIS